ncbi:hypothetical protein BV20DRAFT_1029453 [Pilatotrama ljubarskyi]|nr:hypothetical protein BV20DRAFT_1029453 [Pilatotrama ljubarskyi]
MSSGSPQLVDDTNPRVQYQPGWIWDQGVAEVHNTRHGAGKAGLQAWLSFTGTGVEVVGTLGPSSDNGQPKTSYSIDGQVVGSYDAPSSGSTQYNVTFFKSGNLAAGDHVIRINNTDGTSPNVFWLDYFLIYTSPIPDSPPAPVTSPTSPTPTPSTSPTSTSPPSATSTGPLVTPSTTVHSSQESKHDNTPSGSSASTHVSSQPTTISSSGSANETTASVQYIITSAGGAPTTVTLPQAASQASSTSVDSPAGDAASSASHSDSNLGIIVGAVAGVVALALIVVLFLVILRQRRRKANEVAPFHFSQEQFASRSRVTTASESPTKLTRRPYNDYGSSASLPSGTDAMGPRPALSQRSETTTETATSPSAASHTDDVRTVSGPLTPLRRSPSPSSPIPPPSTRSIPPSTRDGSSSRRTSNTKSSSRSRRTVSPSPIRFAPPPESPRMTSVAQTPVSTSTAFPGFPPSPPLVSEGGVPPGLWHAPPGMHSRAHSLLRSVFSRSARSTSETPVPVVQDMDSGLRLYDEAVLLPPPYTQD